MDLQIRLPMVTRFPPLIEEGESHQNALPTIVLSAKHMAPQAYTQMQTDLLLATSAKKDVLIATSSQIVSAFGCD